VPGRVFPEPEAWQPQIPDQPIFNGPMISPKRCPTIPTRSCRSQTSTCRFEIPIRSRRKNRWRSKTTLAEPLAWERRGPVLGRHRGCSLAILQINLEPHHSLVKELFFQSLRLAASRRLNDRVLTRFELGDHSPGLNSALLAFANSAVRSAV
jgi:hypothetical protein